MILGVAGNIVKKKIKRRLRTRSVKENDFCSIRGLEKICDARERRSHGNNSQLVSNLDLRNCVPTNDSPEFGTAAQLSVSTNKSQSEASHGWHNPILECSPLRSISQALAPSQHSVIQSSDLSTYNPQPRFLNLCVNFQFRLKLNFISVKTCQSQAVKMIIERYNQGVRWTWGPSWILPLDGLLAVPKQTFLWRLSSVLLYSSY